MPVLKQRFEWDEEKNRINRIKHGVRFESAIHVFDDENYVVLYDEEHSLYEDRYLAIGMVKNILTVVYTVRTNSIRIISARKASEEERRTYYDRLLHVRT